MNFCRECGSVMTKTTTAPGGILFVCRCQRQELGGPNDTLMLAGYVADVKSTEHNVFIEQSPYDAAANIIFADCPDCHIDFMVMIQVGKDLTTMYTCDCGYRDTYENYMKNINIKLAAPPEGSKK